MNDPHISAITPEALDEFIRQLFACNWVLGQMIAGMIERAQSDPDDADQASSTDDAYSMIRRAIGQLVDRHDSRQIEAARNLIDEVLDAISDDKQIFPPAQRL